MSDSKIVVWFRQDLRLKDNPAFHFAAQQGTVLPIYIEDTSKSKDNELGGASKWWLHHSLEQLNVSLDNKLAIFKGNPVDILLNYLQNNPADTIVWNRCYQPWQIKRDEKLKTLFKENGFKAKSFNGSLLWEPMTVLKKDETPYKVYTPYYRKGCLQKESPRYPLPAPEKIICEKVTPSCFDMENTPIEGLEELDLLPKIKWDDGFSELWQPGEKGASTRLSDFIENAAKRYKDDRNIPSVSGTSKLSPHLHFGEISPHQIWYAILDNFSNAMDNKDLDCYLSEIGWREFSYYLLYHWPHIPNENFNKKFDRFPWKKHDEGLKAWQQGNTGIPIVDAGMRELWQTGYMHNRVRMIVGSFLVKNLLIDWREGERWFWDCLIDADLASNSAGWQWVAGSGADASPYFRIFNPILQGERFDKEGQYVKQYCPELNDLPQKYIHKPWEASEDVLRKANITLGKDYPKPIVDLKATRQRALDAFSEMKSDG